MNGAKSSRMKGYIMCAGKCGLTFSCLSYCCFFNIECVADDSITKEPKVIVDLAYDNLVKIIDE
jgi:hypothetical protein